MQPAIYIYLSVKWQLHATCKASNFEARMLHACSAAPVQLSTFFTSVHYPCTKFYDTHLAIASWRGTDFGKKLSAKIGPLAGCMQLIKRAQLHPYRRDRAKIPVLQANL